ncbi:hypothetical protein Q3G72_017144 [Acer saccharum]|nr:hypothetical protein Q3G72_017144 [Acer saccharum]
MMTKREYDDEEGYSQLGFENPLLPLANTYDDEEDNGRKEQNGGQVKRSKLVQVRKDCPYLDTVNCHVLDFDFRKLYYVSLSDFNVYACLTEKVYCLPDGYEINDPSLDDIRHVLHPRFTKEQVEQIDKNKPWSRALDGSDYLPGMVSPHEFLQAVMGRFQIGPLSKPFKFMSWLLNTLHKDLRTSKKNASIIYECFQGELEVVKEIPNRTGMKEDEDDQNGVQKIIESGGGGGHDNITRETCRMPFLMLGLDLPPPPLFKDVMEKNIIPQDYIPLPTPEAGNERLRSKYDLIANIIHDGKPEELWYEIQDLHVSKTLPQMVALSEAYMQIYERQQ